MSIIISGGVGWWVGGVAGGILNDLQNTLTVHTFFVYVECQRAD